MQGVGNSLKEITLLLRDQSGKMKWADTTMKGAWVEDIDKSVVKATWSVDLISVIILALPDLACGFSFFCGMRYVLV